MPRRKIHNEHIRKLQVTRGTYSLSLPIRLIRQLAWKERQKLVVKKLGRNKLAISDWK